jgi:hypothetical protein
MLRQFLSHGPLYLLPVVALFGPRPSSPLVVPNGRIRSLTITCSARSQWSALLGLRDIVIRANTRRTAERPQVLQTYS